MASKKEREVRKRRKESAKKWAEKESQGFTPTAVKLPDGMKLYKLDEEGKHRFDIMPFIAGDNYPSGRGGADPGFEVSRMTYEQHRIPQPDGNFGRFVCTYGTWGEECVVCKHRNTANLSQEEKDVLRPQRRHLFLVNDKPGDVKNPLKVMDAVHFNRKLGFGEQLTTAIETLEEDCFIADLKDGKTIQIMVADKKYGSVSRIDLLNRTYSYPESLIDDAPPLDQCVLRPEKEDVLKALGIGEESEEHPRSSPSGKQSKNGSSTTADDDEEDREEDDDGDPVNTKVKKGDLVLYGGEECEVVHVSGDGSSLRLENEEGEIYRGVDSGEVEPIKGKEDDDEDSEDESEEDEDDEWEDEDSDAEEDENEDEEEPEPVVAKKPVKKRVK